MPVLYSVVCEADHRSDLSLDQLEDALQGGTCPECSANVTRTDPAFIHVKCIECQSELEGSWLDVATFFQEGCPTCRSNNESGGRLVVAGSTAAEISDYDEMFVREERELRTRPMREDYWEYVTHFCTPGQFEGILKDRTLRAAETGYFGVPAVCLTDAPFAFTKDIQDQHGSCGLVFRKSDLIAEGGGPAVYLAPSTLEAQRDGPGFSPVLMPFINILRPRRITEPGRKPVDWLHEREWRFPRDIRFEEISPRALILPSGKPRQRLNVFERPLDVVHAALEFGELPNP